MTCYEPRRSQSKHSAVLAMWRHDIIVSRYGAEDRNVESISKFTARRSGEDRERVPERPFTRVSAKAKFDTVALAAAASRWMPGYHTRQERRLTSAVRLHLQSRRDQSSMGTGGHLDLWASLSAERLYSSRLYTVKPVKRTVSGKANGTGKISGSCGPCREAPVERCRRFHVESISPFQDQR